MARLQGKTAVITGATGGQGRIACMRFAEEGATVIGTDLDAAAGADLTTELQEKGFAMTYVAADLADPEGVERLAVAAREFDGIDILYANHGIILGKPLLETSIEEWDHVQDVNIKSVFLLTKALAPLMEGRAASIVNVSSVGGLTVFPNLSAYGAAKAGLAMFSKCAAVDLAQRGIRVNAICPGVIDTAMPRNFVATLPDNPDEDEVMKGFAQGHVLGRLGRPEEVVNLALFLASDESSFMTGSVLTVDGGWSLQ
ncbi:dihydroanticapsin 7-dehydrogenase [Actinomycetospora sp. NBRC 106375]|uniref:SDR family NAD(P)-dependent oxidoreductase n=1 Tax=Actinomycetospora sp. NBRC 106375 TaxID=3032207 RepID=UPI0024A14FD5|nr:SDR family NAD(P)-dependent oxidoreductase [Actinomycetospora sp. NBRC 106375]GLZ50364.1 dihydroanticapsin 7-dehydrogenase [Actinomycetospora sp. NBRC 106375]